MDNHSIYKKLVEPRNTCWWKFKNLKCWNSLFSENDIPLEGSFRFTFAAPNEISSPEPTPVESATPKAEVSNWGTNAFVIGMLVVALFVLVLLSLYARKIFKER